MVSTLLTPRLGGGGVFWTEIQNQSFIDVKRRLPSSPPSQDSNFTRRTLTWHLRPEMTLYPPPPHTHTLRDKIRIFGRKFILPVHTFALQMVSTLSCVKPKNYHQRSIFYLLCYHFTQSIFLSTLITKYFCKSKLVDAVNLTALRDDSREPTFYEVFPLLGSKSWIREFITSKFPQNPQMKFQVH